MEEKIRLLLASYTLEELLEDNDITEEALVENLINKGWISLGLYFEEENVFE